MRTAVLFYGECGSDALIEYVARSNEISELSEPSWPTTLSEAKATKEVTSLTVPGFPPDIEIEFSLQDVSSEVLSVRDRILSFCEYPDDWMGEGSKAPDSSWLTWLASTFSEHYKTHPIPSVFLTPDGNVEMEWSNLGRSASLTVLAGSRKATWYSFCPEDNHDDRDFEQTLNFDRDGWKDLNYLTQSLFSIG